jgi:hypothetical protein
MPEFDAPIGPASAVRATGRSLRRMTARWSVVLVAAAALLGAGAWQWLATDDTVRGTRTPASVVDVMRRVVGSARTESAIVRVQFTVDGEPKQAAVRVGKIDDRFVVGHEIDVVYDPSNPQRIAIEGVPSRTPSVPAASLCGLGLVLAVAGAVGARKVWWMRRIISRYAWVPVSSSLLETEVHGIRERTYHVLVLRDDTGTVLAERVDHGLVPQSLEPVAWVAGLGRPRFVVAPPGGAPTIPMKPARRVRRAAGADTPWRGSQPA